MPPSEKEIDDCLRVLETLAEDRAELLGVEVGKRHRLLTAAGRVSRPERNEQRRLLRAARRKDKHAVKAQDEALLSRAQIRQKRLGRLSSKRPEAAASSRASPAPSLPPRPSST